jgi:DNA polymerase III subunit alpha
VESGSSDTAGGDGEHRFASPSALRELCEAGLIWRYGEDGITDEIRARLERELQVLADKLISAYFLIVWDFVNWARRAASPPRARLGRRHHGRLRAWACPTPAPCSTACSSSASPTPTAASTPISISTSARTAGGSHRVRPPEVRPRRADHHLRPLKAKARDPRRRPRAHPAARGRQGRKLVGDGLGITLDKALEQEPDLKALRRGNPFRAR